MDHGRFSYVVFIKHLHVCLFFDKGNLLILRDTNYIQPLQLRNTKWQYEWTQPKKKKKLRKEKTRHSILVLAATIHPPPRQHLNSRLFKSDAFKKGTVHKRHRRPIKDLGFSP
jgi:hypothetical protein